MQKSGNNYGSWRERGPWLNRRDGNGRFERAMPNTDVFLTPDGHHDGVSAVNDTHLSKSISDQLASFVGSRLFPVSWSNNMTDKNVEKLKQRPHVVGVVPKGIKYILYIDRFGDIYLQNHYREMFRVDDDRKVQFPGQDGRLLKDSLFDGVLTELVPMEDSEQKPKKRLVFVILDVTKCNGVDISRRGIIDRMTYLESNVMEQRRKALASRSVDIGEETFEIAVTEYKELCHTSDYIDRGEFLSYSDAYKYQLRSLHFVPKQQGYVFGQCTSLLRWDFQKDAKFCFLLKIEQDSKGVRRSNLHVRKGQGILSSACGFYDTIDLTEDLLKLDGSCIQCEFIDSKWVFTAQLVNRHRPFTLSAVKHKMERLQEGLEAEVLLSYI